MKMIQNYTDKAAIGLSFLCTMHCLAFPLIIVLLPSFAALPLNDEAFHLWMIVAVVPTSAFALTMGCQRHGRYQLLFLGFIGISCLMLAVVLGEWWLTELWEKILTTVGACFTAYGHYKNYQLCQLDDHCECSQHCDEPLK